MKSVQIIDSLLLGQAQSLLLTFTNESIRRGNPVTVISLFRSLGSSIELALREAGAELKFLPSGKLYDRERASQLAEAVRLARPDILHTHLRYSNILGAITARALNLPLVSSLYPKPPQHGWQGALTGAAERLFVQSNASRVVAVQAGLDGAGWVIIQPGVEIQSLPSAEEKAALRREIAGDETSPLVTATERLAEHMGAYDVLAAFALVARQHPTARLVMIGDGRILPQAQKRGEELGLGERVLWLRERQDVHRLLRGADVHISATRQPGLPLTVLEAWAAGLPVVTTQTGALAADRVAQMGCGVPPEDPDELAKAVLSLLDNPEWARSLGQAGREYASQNHEASQWVDKIEAVYASVLPPELAGETL